MLIEKEIIAPGSYYYTDSSNGTPRRLDVSSDLTAYWCDQGTKMIASGLTIPVPFEHDFNAHPMTPKEQILNNAGEVKEYKLKDFDDPIRGKVRNALFGVVEVQDPDAKRKIGHSIRWTSPWINSFTDGNGKQWQNVISHLALTTRPRITRQEPFPSIAAALSLAAPLESIKQTPREGIYLSRACEIVESSGLLLPRYPVAFSLFSGVALARDYKRDDGGRFASTTGGKSEKPKGEKVVDKERVKRKSSGREKQVNRKEQLITDVDNIRDERGEKKSFAKKRSGKKKPRNTAEELHRSREKGHRDIVEGIRRRRAQGIVGTAASDDQFEGEVAKGKNLSLDASLAFNPNQKRSDDGKFASTSGGGSSSEKPKKRKKKVWERTEREQRKTKKDARESARVRGQQEPQRGDQIEGKDSKGKHLSKSPKVDTAQAKKSVSQRTKKPKKKGTQNSNQQDRDSGKTHHSSGQRRKQGRFARHHSSTQSREQGKFTSGKRLSMGDKNNFDDDDMDDDYEDEDDMDFDDEDDGDMDDDDEMPDDGDPSNDDTVDLEPYGDPAGDVSMSEVLCDLLRALGINCEHTDDEASFKRNLYTGAMTKIHELTSESQDPNKPKPGSMQPPKPGSSPQSGQQNQPNPLIQQEQQPMYMSLEDINKITDPVMKNIALSMYNENVKLRGEVEANASIANSLRDAKLKEATAQRDSRVAMLSKVSPRVKTDLAAMLASPSMALSMGEGGSITDPMAPTLAVLEKGLADIPRLLTAEVSALSVQPQPTDGEMSNEEVDTLSDNLARMMGCAPERKAS